MLKGRYKYMTAIMSRLPCYVFCICLLTNIDHKYKVESLHHKFTYMHFYAALILMQTWRIILPPTESLGDLHAMIPGFTDLIGVFAIKVPIHILGDCGYI